MHGSSTRSADGRAEVCSTRSVKEAVTDGAGGGRTSWLRYCNTYQQHLERHKRSSKQILDTIVGRIKAQRAFYLEPLTSQGHSHGNCCLSNFAGHSPAPRRLGK